MIDTRLSSFSSRTHHLHSHNTEGLWVLATVRTIIASDIIGIEHCQKLAVSLFYLYLLEIPFGQQFSHVKRGCLAESEKETLLTRLCDDLEKVKMTFASLVSKTLRSLKAHNINFTELKVLITTYVKSKSLTKLLSKKKTLEKIFIAFRDYWSFFDYEILSLIISNFCTELEKEKNEYISAFNEFCKRKVSEVPTNFTSIASGRHYILRVIIKREFDFVTMSELKELEVKLRNITKIDLSLFRSEGGSLVIEFVSLNEEDEMFPLSEKENKELFEMGVLKLYSDSHVYFDYNDYQHSLNTYTSAPHFNQPLQNQHSTSHLVPFDEEWSVDCALKEDKTTSYIPLGSYSHSYPILDSSSPSIDSKHSLKGKANYKLEFWYVWIVQNNHSMDNTLG